MIKVRFDGADAFNPRAKPLELRSLRSVVPAGAFPHLHERSGLIRFGKEVERSFDHPSALTRDFGLVGAYEEAGYIGALGAVSNAVARRLQLKARH